MTKSHWLNGRLDPSVVGNDIETYNLGLVDAVMYGNRMSSSISANDREDWFVLSDQAIDNLGVRLAKTIY
jgi:hypothetical protein